MGYLAIATRLREAFFPELKPVTLEEIRFVQKHQSAFDLTRMIKLNGWPTETVTWLINDRNPNLNRERISDEGLGPFAINNSPAHRFHIPFVIETGRADLPRAIFMRDSFTEYLIPFLASHFERSLFVGIPLAQHVANPFHVPLIEREQPDLVAEIMIERYLVRKPPPDNPPDLLAALEALDRQNRSEDPPP